MRVLLDTCEFLWLVSGDARLPKFVSDAVQNPANEVFLSVVSYWEVCVKHSLGKLPLPDSPERYVPLQREKHRIASLSLDEVAVGKLVQLPMHHRDPFDRMLICQSLAHDLHFASSDALIRQYSVKLLRASPTT
jgi:PIN domain nuclease of toxin-antitoxin system